MSRINREYDQATRDFAIDAEQCLTQYTERAFAEQEIEQNNAPEGQKRDPFSRDFGRIIYSSSFRRLQGKMQLLPIQEGTFHRNRMSHSWEVAQIAREIAVGLGLNTTYVAEACSLAHDIGNPPFGHCGERVLDELAHDFGGFEGNAQTLRVIRFLEKKHPQFCGLNLTERTLLGVIKYPFIAEENFDKPRKFIYLEDHQFLQRLVSPSPVNKINTIDKQIMDLADEIAYAAHDLEDCLANGVFSLEEFEGVLSGDVKIQFDPIVDDCRKFARKSLGTTNSEKYSFYLRKSLTSQIVDTLIRDIGVGRNKDGNKELMFISKDNLQDELKMKSLCFVRRRPETLIYEKTGSRVLKGLFLVYSDDSFNPKNELLPPEFRSEDILERKRKIIDYLAGMMDSYAIEQYEKYFGKGSLQAKYP